MKLFSLFLVVGLLGSWITESAHAAPLELLTANEAAQPNLPISKGGKTPTDIIGAKQPTPGGPQIIVDKPEQSGGVSCPFPVKIRFVPAGGARINLDSLEIDVLKLVRISLLSRVKPYMSAKGIDVPEAKIPSGTYNIQISIADDQGRLGVTTRTWTVL